ncbi:AfsR/SARP family transcriptional regulator [Allobranchiibius huperziae]|uniref:DNA-binding SARP family transcriptional activator n=1 Tax=Allobranchiibius huperziae TaxID=1874116 RepID=A0A853DLU1_9MICO|nr:BTAD domain-containing putative transcriptional regulator [Allobranchiibius huperziae]NYJ75600.1 DNA-binding SARP family transcriptional activator [Allobranchiibius huperziae]
MTRSPENVRFFLFGGVRIVRDGVEIAVTQPKQRGLLALLLANVGETLTVDSIVDALWNGEPAPTAVNQIHRHVGALRRACQPGLGRRHSGRFITGIGRGYRMAVDPDACDVTEFRQVAARARELGDTGEHAAALQQSLQALAVASSPAGAEGMHDMPEFASIEDERVSAILTAAGQCRRATDYAAILPALRSAAEHHPFNEALAASLMDALAYTGRGAEAVHLYRTVRRRLTTELGCEPGPQLKRALADALRHNSSRPVDTEAQPKETALPRPAQLPMPLPGFGGRRRLLAALAESATQRRVLHLTGAAGVGKTGVAVRHATQIVGQYPDGQLYVDLHGHDPTCTPTDVLDALEDMLVGLHIPSHAMPQSIGARSGLLRSVLSALQVLILLDDARDFAQIKPLLPGPGRSDVIVTSQSSMPELVAFHHAELVQLTSLDDVVTVLEFSS